MTVLPADVTAVAAAAAQAGRSRRGDGKGVGTHPRGVACFPDAARSACVQVRALCQEQQSGLDPLADLLGFG